MGQVYTKEQQPVKVKNALKTLYSSRTVVATYIGSGLQLFVAGSIIVWMPSYLNRYYAMPTDKAGILAVIVLGGAVGTIFVAC